MALNRDAILSAGRTLPFEDVPADEITKGETIRVRCLTATENQKYQAGFWKADPNAPIGVKPAYSIDDASARLLVLACCEVNPDGSNGPPLFTAADVSALLEINGALAMRLFEAAQRVSGLNRSVEEIKQLVFGVAQSTKG